MVVKGFSLNGILGLILGIWIIAASIIAIILSYKINLKYKLIKKINPHIAHIGVGIAIVGITCSSVFKEEYDYNLKVGDSIQMENINIIFENIETSNEINYQALRANFSINKNKELISNVQAGKNYYPVSKMITSEAGILHEFFRDIYFIVGDQKDNNWFIKIYINPFVSFIWLGVSIMIVSGIVGVTKK